jgi:uncharacterized protein YjbK
MLVLNTAVHHEDSWQPITKYLKRVGDNVEQLLEAISEINLYLPDDWRMTRSRNNFRILVVPRVGKMYLMVGSSYRSDNNAIIHIIDSIFEPHFFDKYDLQAIFGVTEQVIDDRIRRKYDEMLKPNLYFFQKCPDDSLSPLFARQYEKVKPGDDGVTDEIHFHRIHPLFKWGLDSNHYKWIQWDIDGKIKQTNYPARGYHGKDFWKIPHINDAERAKVSRYIDSQKLINEKYNIIEFKQPESFTPTYAYEFKFLPDPEHAKGAMNNVLGYLKNHGYSLVKCGTKEQTDTYFDDEILSLYEKAISFRFRETDASARVTLKMRMKDKSTNEPTNEYQRIEEEATISESEKETLKSGGQINAFPYRLLSYVVPECKKLYPVVTVKTTRELVEVSNKDHQKAEICFDTVMYEMNGVTVGPDHEIEIESKGLPREDLKHIANDLKDQLKLVMATESKYERAIIFCRTS